MVPAMSTGTHKTSYKLHNCFIHDAL